MQQQHYLTDAEFDDLLDRLADPDCQIGLTRRETVAAHLYEAGIFPASVAEATDAPT